MTTISVSYDGPTFPGVAPTPYFPSTTAPTGWYVATICPRCGGGHAHGECPDVRAIEYYPDGRVKRVEYFEGTGRRLTGTVTVTWAKTPLPDDAIVRDWTVYLQALRPTDGREEEE
jgi:hypothetical protein